MPPIETVGPGSDAAFEAFAAAADVDVGQSNKAPSEADIAAAPKPKEPEAKPAGEPSAADVAAADAAAADPSNEDLDENATPEERDGYIKRLKRERAEARREARDTKARLATLEGTGLAERLAALENKGSTNENAPTTAVDAIGPKPDPMDQTKYPLGQFDAQYVEDRADWAAEMLFAKRTDADLQRQQENQRNQSVVQQQQRLNDTVKTVAAKGAEMYDDYQETVVDAGMKGLWKLEQPTFEAAAEVDHGHQILYDLAKNPTEALRVSKLSARQQILFVEEKNAEYVAKNKPRKIPQAGAPAITHTRGANSRTAIDPATDNLDDFAKVWNQK